MQLYSAIQDVRDAINPNLQVYGILVTMFDTRMKVSQKTVLDAERLAEIIKTKVFETKIRSSSKMKEIADEGKDIFEYAPRSTSAEDYANFTDEVIALSKK